MSERPSYLNPDLIIDFIHRALAEDIGSGDHSTLAAIDPEAEGEATIIIKGDGVLAGSEVAQHVFKVVDDQLQVQIFKKDGENVMAGDIALSVKGKARSILSSERLVLNFMQRMSGIATKTQKILMLIEGTSTQLLDTRKTTPNFRIFEKWAVKIGGGNNHRFALHDMIMLKDNHIDYVGGIKKAVSKTKKYLSDNELELQIEVETRTIKEVREALEAEVDIIMLDNMSVGMLEEAVLIVGDHCATEASGGIDEHNIRAVAETGVDYISVGALTHSYQSLDMSLKAILDQ